MKASLRGIIGRFCTTAKDTFFTFDQSQLTLCAVVKNMSKLQDQDLKLIQDLGVRRIIYSLTSEEETTNFLAERHDKVIQTLFTSPWLMKGIQFHLPVHLDEKDPSKKIAFKQLLQISQHLQTFRPKAHKEDIQIYISLTHNEAKIEDLSKLALAMKNNLDAIENVIENSFSFKLNYNINYCPVTPIDFEFDVAQKHPSFFKSLDLDVFRHADVNKPTHEQNKHILSTAYQNNLINYNTVFMRNLKVSDKLEWVHNSNIQEGVLSYQHLFDMLKMLHFQGSLAVQYDGEYFESNVKFLQEMILQQKYTKHERANITDQRIDYSGQTDTLVDI